MANPVARVDREDGKAKRVVIDAGVFRLSFIVGRNGKIVEEPGTKIRLDGARLCDVQSLCVPRAHYCQARIRAAAILREKRPQGGSKR